MSGIAVEAELTDKLGRFPPEVEVAAFRIVQEALVNLRRHSGSRTGRVQIAEENGRLKVRVSDQGKGIPQGSREGLGIKGMRDRVLRLGGQFALTSNGQGTVVEARLPI